MARKNIVVLTGAGISAESGLKTFRDTDGLWEGYNIEEVATPRAWRRDPKLVLDFYNMRRKNVAEAKPNAAHIGLAELEKDFDVHIITQNIDDLHERGGSSQVTHLHGEIFKMRSERNPSLIKEIKGDIQIGDLAKDGFQYRPYIVWFEEPVPKIEEAILLVKKADVFVIVGTSLLVYPAAGLIDYAPRGIPVFIIDKKISLSSIRNEMILIEKPATEGVADLKKMLEKL